MQLLQSNLQSVHAALGRRPVSLWWAKLEIAIGLTAAAFGVISAVHPAVAVALIALGGYLALAGHRSHLYDAMSRQTAIAWRGDIDCDTRDGRLDR